MEKYDWLDKFLGWPYELPRAWRRAYVLTFPISGPLIFILQTLLVLVVIAGWFLFNGPSKWLVKLWYDK
jgi:hypothetical protein